MGDTLEKLVTYPGWFQGEKIRASSHCFGNARCSKLVLREIPTSNAYLSALKMPINFLSKNLCDLNNSEKADMGLPCARYRSRLVEYTRELSKDP